MIGIADLGQAETDLCAGTLACPSCTGPLQPWGHARARTVRDHGTSVVALRPRRARCRTCRGTHVLLPTVVAPCRADTTARAYTAPHHQVMRAKIVLLAAAGVENTVIADRLDVGVQLVSKWRKRFFEEGLDGLKDRQRTGRPRAFSPLWRW